MFTPTRTALCIALGAMAVAASDANAGCKLISGTKVCASWIKGSEICNVRVTGIPPGDGGEGSQVSCAVGEFDSSLVGTLFCGPPSPPAGAKCKRKDDDEEEEEDDEDSDGAPTVACEATPNFSLPTTSFPFSNSEFVKNFIKPNGSLKVSIEVDVTSSGGLCTDPNFPTFMTFTANQFSGTTNVFIPNTGEGSPVNIELDQQCTSIEGSRRYDCTVFTPGG